jgi:hypothetical protein
VATYSSVRSANRAARVAERALQAGLRPLLLPTRPTDPEEKVSWVDDHWTKVSGGLASVELGDEVIYLSMSVRNVGSGIAVLQSWQVRTDLFGGAALEHDDPESFRRLSRDLYIPAGDSGFWQGAIRDRNDPLFDALAADIKDRTTFAVDVLYGDHEGGQRAISRFRLSSVRDELWVVGIVRHWNLDRSDPR